MKFVNGHAVSEDPLVPAWVPPLVLAVLGAVVLIGIMVASRRTASPRQTSSRPVVTAATPEAITVQGGAPGDAGGQSGGGQGTGEAVRSPPESPGSAEVPPTDPGGAPLQVGSHPQPLVPGSAPPAPTGVASPAPLPGSDVPRYTGSPLPPGEVAPPGVMPPNTRFRGMVPAR